MDMFDTNLQNVFKEFRKNKKLIPSFWPKILGFQLFKGLYYLKVLPLIGRTTTCATAT